ncbi:MAG TPA: hypothetical protein VFX80_09945 [Solirubrobacteraceae bacterium]|nr:hypothetical protein [Solirubrobacteraceae bacterium]
MEIEIHTTTGTWITYVDDQEFADQEPGAAAGDVRHRIKEGKAIDVTAAAGPRRPHARHGDQMVVFNPGHVVAVVEMARLPRFGRAPRTTQR